jgi:hypothetical protein
LHTWAKRYTDSVDQFHTWILFKWDAEIPCTVLLVATNVAKHWGKNK